MPFKEHSGRSPNGRVRNLRAMTPDKFLAVRADVLAEGNDGDAITAVNAEYVRRWGWGAQAGKNGHQFIGKDEWDRFYDTVNADPDAQDYFCARCGSWAGDHRAEAPPMCPDTHVGGYSPTYSFATEAWLDEHLVSTEPQPLSALLEELLG